MSRRAALLVPVAVLVGAAAGGLSAAIGPLGLSKPRRPPPADLLAALDAEAHLLAVVEAASAANPDLQVLLDALRADHAEHLRVLTAAVGAYSGSPSGEGSTPATGAGGRSPIPSRTASQTVSRAGLRSAEQQAARAAASRARRLTGADAVVLASIAACEATHAELLRLLPSCSLA